MAHAHYILNSYIYKYTLRICNAYCFSTAQMVTRKRLNLKFMLTLSFLLLFLTIIFVGFPVFLHIDSLWKYTFVVLIK